MTNDKVIAELNARIEQLENEQASLRESLAEARMEQWEGRLEDAEVQLHLASMEIFERLQPVIDGARNQMLDARARVESGTSTASDAAAALRTGLEKAWADIRDALEQTKTIVIR